DMGKADTVALARLWDTSGWKLRHALQVKGVVSHAVTVAFSPDGMLATGGKDTAVSSDGVPLSAGDTVRLWDPATGREVPFVKGLPRLSGHIACSRNGLLAVDTFEGLQLWDVTTGLLRGRVGGRELQITSLAISDDGQTLAAGTFAGTIRFWKLTSWVNQKPDELPPIRAHSRAVTAVAFSPDVKKLASGSKDGTTKVWDLPAEQQCR